MMRTGCCLGTVLMLVAFAILFGLVVFPALPGGENHPLLTNTLEPLFCKASENLVEETLVQRDLRGTVSSPRYYCENEAGERRDVTNKAVLYGIVGFVVPFLGGLFLSIAGLTGIARKGVSSALDMSRYTPGEDGTLRVGGIPVRVSAAGTPSAGSSSAGASSAGSKTAAEKLREIENLRAQNLITEDEYARLRAEVLDSSF